MPQINAGIPAGGGLGGEGALVGFGSGASPQVRSDVTEAWATKRSPGLHTVVAVQTRSVVAVGAAVSNDSGSAGTSPSSSVVRRGASPLREHTGDTDEQRRLDCRVRG